MGKVRFKLLSGTLCAFGLDTTCVQHENSKLISSVFLCGVGYGGVEENACGGDN